MARVDGILGQKLGYDIYLNKNVCKLSLSALKKCTLQRHNISD